MSRRLSNKTAAPACSEKYIGKTYGNKKILSFSHRTYTTYFYNVLCLDCDKPLTISLVSILRRVNICKGHQGKSDAEVWKLKRAYTGQLNRRGLTFTLSDMQFKRLVYSPCFYCGSLPQNGPSGETSGIKLNGIDRKDNDLGYDFLNCVPCCRYCNYAKHTRSVGEFNAWITRLVNHQLNSYPEKHFDLEENYDK